MNRERLEITYNWGYKLGALISWRIYAPRTQEPLSGGVEGFEDVDVVLRADVKRHRHPSTKKIISIILRPSNI